MNKIILLVIILALATPNIALSADDEHQHAHENDSHSIKTSNSNDGHEHEAEGDNSITMSPESIKEAGIAIEPLSKRSLEKTIKASGEVKINSYLSSKVTPRISAQVIARHVKLGDKVTKGQALITLSSVEMADAVGNLLVTNKEWNRVKRLGASAVSAKRYSEAKIAYKQARAKVLAYGMTEQQISELYSHKAKNALGEFQLLSPQEGTIVSDDFIEGELIEAGRVLFDIVNEDILWVESQLSPKQAEQIKVGATASVRVPNDGWLEGKVVQKHHLIDEETRTIGIRIEVHNEKDKLHPGMFVDTKIQTGKGNEYLAIPTEAVLRSADGDWIIFIEEDNGHFKPVEVDIVKTVGEYTAIEGVAEGTRVVTSGAFFIQSEMAKSGFAVHNH